MIEYNGDVINEEVFLERVDQYAIENVEHFYFMALSSTEYLGGFRC